MDWEDSKWRGVRMILFKILKCIKVHEDIEDTSRYEDEIYLEISYIQ